MWIIAPQEQIKKRLLSLLASLILLGNLLLHIRQIQHVRPGNLLLMESSSSGPRVAAEEQSWSLWAPALCPLLGGACARGSAIAVGRCGPRCAPFVDVNHQSKSERISPDSFLEVSYLCGLTEQYIL